MTLSKVFVHFSNITQQTEKPVEQFGEDRKEEWCLPWEPGLLSYLLDLESSDSEKNGT